MKSEFLYASITDTQGTIRAIDTRAGFILVILFLPLSVADKLKPIYMLPSELPLLVIAWLTLSFAFWIVALWSSFRCIVGIDNPSDHVYGTTNNGAFYSADLFNLGLVDVFFNMRVSSSRNVVEETKRLPQTDDELVSELVFEKMKLAYIRAVKIKRFTAACWFTLIWLTISATLAFYGRVVA